MIRSSAETPNGKSYPAVVTATNSAAPTFTNVIVGSIGINPFCIHTNPRIILDPASLTSVAGGHVSYSVNVTNLDNTSCDSSTFTLSAVIPAGVEASLAQNTVTLAPGATGSATLHASSPAVTASGTYHFVQLQILI